MLNYGNYCTVYALLTLQVMLKIYALGLDIFRRKIEVSFAPCY